MIDPFDVDVLVSQHDQISRKDYVGFGQHFRLHNQTMDMMADELFALGRAFRHTGNDRVANQLYLLASTIKSSTERVNQALGEASYNAFEEAEKGSAQTISGIINLVTALSKRHDDAPVASSSNVE